MSYGKRYELHLNNKEAKKGAKVLTSATGYFGTVHSVINNGPLHIKLVVAITGVYTTNQVNKLGKKIKKKNKGKGVYIIY
ncbi:hypothetical protein [Peribacillus simplex]|uniref:hypothetical protein n=1 Tax=Peribacillus simplex TaxID=1478 RepID=UPI003D2CD50D